jgi:hypothetical protein
MNERTKLGLATVANALAGYATLAIGVWNLTNGHLNGWIWTVTSVLWLMNVYFRSSISYSRGAIASLERR